MIAELNPLRRLKSGSFVPNRPGRIGRISRTLHGFRARVGKQSLM